MAINPTHNANDKGQNFLLGGTFNPAMNRSLMPVDSGGCGMGESCRRGNYQIPNFVTTRLQELILFEGHRNTSPTTGEVRSEARFGTPACVALRRNPRLCGVAGADERLSLRGGTGGEGERRREEGKMNGAVAGGDDGDVSKICQRNHLKNKNIARGKISCEE
jgi:hypothetical protein